ncbi:MAG: hypothetical protein JXA89_00195 [Anaerolineae bacterium]|nr:hypothetical protein [Anaerolineae bacterium]
MALQWRHNRIRSGMLALCWALALVSMGLFGILPTSYANQSIQVQLNEHEFAFGQYVRFHLQAAGDRPLQSVVLAYRTLDTQGTIAEAIEFDSSLAIDLDYVHDIQTRYIRPFVEVSYWWTIQDVAGEQLITEPKTFTYLDNRFDWDMRQEGAIRLHWYQGELAIAQQALNTSLAGLERARQDIPVGEITRPIDIYLYADHRDLQVALPGPLLVGEEARTLYETNVILVSFSPQAENIPRLQRVLPHEITHTLIHEATRNDFARIPFWLTEGLATSVEYAFMPDPNAQQLIQDVIENDDVIPFSTLCAAFPASQERARLAYAQSASLIGFIRDTQGRQKLHDLLAAYADGATCEGGVQRVLARSLDRLESDWIESLAPRSKLGVFWDENGAWVILFFVLVGFPAFFLIPARVRP